MANQETIASLFVEGDTVSVTAGEAAGMDWPQPQSLLPAEVLPSVPGRSAPAETNGKLAFNTGRLSSWADSWFRREALAAPPPDLAEPFSLPWFLALEYQRHHRQARWLAEILEFRRHEGETVLAVGHGLGTDWVQYARYGARVIVCCPAADELEVAKQQFQLRALPGIFLHCPQPDIPLPSNLADLACVSLLLREGEQSTAWLSEVRRVLKPGGKLLILESAQQLGCWQGWRWMRQICSLLTDFQAIKMRRHHLPRKEVPWLLRWLPRRWLERLLGRFFIVRAVKPVIAPSQHRLAA